MLRRSLVVVGAVVVALGGADLAARFILGCDLVVLAGRAPTAAAPIPEVRVVEVPLVSGVETKDFAVVALVSPRCRHNEVCVVSLTLHPAMGRTLNVHAPFAFRARPSDVLVYENPNGTFKPQPQERTPVRVVVNVVLRTVGTGPHTLEGQLNVYTCDVDSCRSDKSAMSIPLG